MKDQRVVKGENLISLLYFNDWLVPSSMVDEYIDQDNIDENKESEVNKIK